MGVTLRPIFNVTDSVVVSEIFSLMYCSQKIALVLFMILQNEWIVEGSRRVRRALSPPASPRGERPGDESDGEH